MQVKIRKISDVLLSDWCSLSSALGGGIRLSLEHLVIIVVKCLP